MPRDFLDIPIIKPFFPEPSGGRMEWPSEGQPGSVTYPFAQAFMLDDRKSDMSFSAGDVGHAQKAEEEKKNIHQKALAM
jgi:hypothetical protein